MKDSNRKASSSSARLAAVLAAGLLTASALAMGSAAAESRPTPAPHRGALFSEVQTQTPQAIDLARNEDSASPWRVDPRRDGRNVKPTQAQEDRTNVQRLRPPFGPQGPWYR